MLSGRTPRNGTPPATPKSHEAVDTTPPSAIPVDRQQYVAVAAIPPAIVAVPLHRRNRRGLPAK